MREVIQKVLEAEDEGRRMIEAARAEAEGVVLEARRQGLELVETARASARTTAERIVNAAVAEAERQKQADLARITAEIGTRGCLTEATQEAAVGAVVRCVCGLRKEFVGHSTVCDDQ